MKRKSKKPKDINELIDSVSVRTDKLDGRTSEAREVARIKRGLSDTPIITAKALLKDICARNLMIEKLVYHAAINSPAPLVNADGKVNAIIDKVMLKFQSAGKSALVELLRLGGSASTQPDQSGDVFGDIFEDESDE